MKRKYSFLLSILCLLLVLLLASCDAETNMTELSVFCSYTDHSKTLAPVYNDIEHWVLTIERILSYEEDGKTIKETEQRKTIEKDGNLWKCDTIVLPYGEYRFTIVAEGEKDEQGKRPEMGRNTIIKKLSSTKDSIEVELAPETEGTTVVGGRLYLPIYLDLNKTPESSLDITSITLVRLFNAEGTDVSYSWDKESGAVQEYLTLEKTSATDSLLKEKTSATDVYVLKNTGLEVDENREPLSPCNDTRLTPGLYRLSIGYQITENEKQWTHTYRENIIVRSAQLTKYRSTVDENNNETLDTAYVILYAQEDDETYENIYFTFDYFENSGERIYRNGIKLKSAYSDKISGSLEVPEFSPYVINNVSYPLQIAMGGFINCFEITEIKLPNGTYFSFGENAFMNCFSLEKISNMPQTMTMGGSLVPYLGPKCFKNCTNLGLNDKEGFTVPKGIIQIQQETFYGCSSLQKINLPDAIMYFGNGAFQNCTSLKQLDLPETWTPQTINGKSVNPNIGSSCFKGSGLESIRIPSGVGKIQKETFNGCASLREVTLPDDINFLDNYAFQSCTSLKSLTLPSSWTSLTLYGTTVDPYIGTGCFRYSGLESIRIPSGIKKIMDNTFDGCKSLSEVTLPSNVYYLGNNAFRNCTSLKSLVLPATMVKTDGTDPYIGTSCFSGSGLESIIIPSGIKKIQDNTFDGCKSLVEVTIPASVTSFGANCFRNCSKLTTINYDGTKAAWNKLGTGWQSSGIVKKNIVVHCSDGDVSY